MPLGDSPSSSDAAPAERIAARIAGALLFVVAALVIAASALSIAGYREPQPTLASTILLIVAALRMPWLAKQERRLATHVVSGSLSADAAESAFCGYMAVDRSGRIADERTRSQILGRLSSCLGSCSVHRERGMEGQLSPAQTDCASAGGGLPGRAPNSRVGSAQQQGDRFRQGILTGFHQPVHRWSGPLPSGPDCADHRACG